MFTTDGKETTSFKILSFVIILLCFMTLPSNMAYPLARSQRQTVSNELATGLTNTGISFQSYGGYNSYSPQDNYYESSHQTGQRGIDSYSGYGSGGYEGYGSVYGGYGSHGYDGGYGKQHGWRGFGAGKTSAGYRPPQTQYGVKY